MDMALKRNWNIYAVGPEILVNDEFEAQAGEPWVIYLKSPQSVTWGAAGKDFAIEGNKLSLIPTEPGTYTCRIVAWDTAFGNETKKQLKVVLK